MGIALVTLVIFIVVYICFVFFPHRRALCAACGALLLILLGSISPQEAFWAVNWNVMGIFVGTLVLAELFMESGMPAFIAERIVKRSPNAFWAVLCICLFTGFISAFVENVATVLIMAPIAFSLSQKLKVNPVKLIVAIAISSNLQGTATLIGDPPSMLLAGFAKMHFWDFFIYHGRPSIFFAVVLGALASLGVLFFIFKNYRQKTSIELKETIKSFVPTVLLVFLIFALAFSSGFDPGFGFLAGLICIGFALAGLIWEVLFLKGACLRRIRSLDWETTLFLAAVFILVGSLTATGWIEKLAVWLSTVIGGNILASFVAIVVISLVASAFVDNVPFLACMLPVVLRVADKVSVEPSLLLFGLLIGACLGGNVTPIGASANIVACGLLKKNGHAVRFGEFVRIGLPLTLASVLAGAVFVWLVWSI